MTPAAKAAAQRGGARPARRCAAIGRVKPEIRGGSARIGIGAAHRARDWRGSPQAKAAGPVECCHAGERRESRRPGRVLSRRRAPGKPPGQSRVVPPERARTPPSQARASRATRPPRPETRTRMSEPLLAPSRGRIASAQQICRDSRAPANQGHDPSDALTRGPPLAQSPSIASLRARARPSDIQDERTCASPFPGLSPP